MTPLRRLLSISNNFLQARGLQDTVMRPQGSKRRGVTRFATLFLLMIIAPAAGLSSPRQCFAQEPAARSRWGVETRDGVSWLVTPERKPFFSIGINALDGGAPKRELHGRIWYHWGTFFPDLVTWARKTRERVISWGFNTAGGWSLPPSTLEMPTIPDLELGRTARFHWFDPFHPSMDVTMRLEARRLVAPYKGSPQRIGYFSDNEVGWWNGPLFAYYLERPATNHTKHKLVELLREHYQESWERFVGDFVAPEGVTSFDDLLSSTGRFPLLRPGGQGIYVVRKWTGIMAERYYQLVHQSLREADPEALSFGDRLPIYYDPVAVRAMVPYVDVMATNYNVDSPDGWIARYYFEGLQQLAGDKPVLISEWFFAAHENRTGNRNNGHLMTVQTQAQRARGAAAAAERFAHIPSIVGIHWFQHYDHPKGGRMDGEDYNFGLVDLEDRPYEELVGALSRVNARLPEIHRASATPRVAFTSREITVPHASIDPHDRSLADWPKEEALVPQLVAPSPEIPFGDVCLAWDERGLHLALIAMDYSFPHLLAYEGEFPLEEAFRLEWGVDGVSGPRRFALYVIPPPKAEFSMKDAYRMHAKLCHGDRPGCEPVPRAVATYFGSDQPRITVELHLPWEAVGLVGPPSDHLLRMELAATAYHRSRWMSWSGLPPHEAMADTARWMTVRLGGNQGRFIPGACGSGTR